MDKTTPLSLREAFDALRFAKERTPTSTDVDDAFCRLAAYRDGAIFLGHWAGRSEWEQHPAGDEMVMVVEGETTLFLLQDGVETPHVLRASQLLVVPRGTWHRFETPRGVKVLTVTPQPTEHSTSFPG